MSNEAGGVGLASVTRLAEYIWQEINCSSKLASSPEWVEHIEKLMLSTLLTAAPHSLSSAMCEPSPSAGPDYLRKAEEYVRANIGAHFTSQELAEIAGTSTRALSKAFSKHRNESPMSFVKRVKLEQARLELLNPNRETKGITDVAMNVGLFHLGNFAADYRKQFGERPSETLTHKSRPFSRTARISN